MIDLLILQNEASANQLWSNNRPLASLRHLWSVGAILAAAVVVPVSLTLVQDRVNEMPQNVEKGVAALEANFAGADERPRAQASLAEVQAYPGHFPGHLVRGLTSRNQHGK